MWVGQVLFPLRFTDEETKIEFMGLKSTIRALDFIIWFCYWNGYYGSQLGCISEFFLNFYQTIFLKSVILNISMFLVCSVLTFWETGKALLSRVRPLSGVRFKCQPRRQTSHGARIIPENRLGKQAVGDWHMSFIKTYKASSSSSFGNRLLSLLWDTRWNSFLFSCCTKNMCP